MGSHSSRQTLAGVLLAAATAVAPAYAAPTAARLGGHSQGVDMTPASAQAQGEPPAVARRLNDTGLTTCVNPYRSGSGKIDCAGSGQDGEFGRDVTARRYRDGRAGFSYVKIGDTGEQLPDDAELWACVFDKVSGLMWEVKTNDDGLRDVAGTYTNSGDDSRLDTSTFVKSVNAAGLCGHSDWRLPDRLELHGLVNYGKSLYGRAGMIVSEWFPNTAGRDYWTVTDNSFWGPGYVWSISFEGGEVNDVPRGGLFLAARLVRNARPPGLAQGMAAAPARFVPNGAEVTDTMTGLVWRRCSEGQTWTGSTCSGDATLTTWRRALDAARGAAADGTAWRLPNIKELNSLVDDTRSLPAINAEVFPQTPASVYWSSSHVVGSEQFVRYVDFYAGQSRSRQKNERSAVRLVRTAP